VTTTSTRLLYLVLYTRSLIFGLSIGVIVYFLAVIFQSGCAVDGFTSHIVSIWFLGGPHHFHIGNICIYIANITGGDQASAVPGVRRVQPSSVVRESARR